jgi:hypothetical protein
MRWFSTELLSKRIARQMRKNCQSHLPLIRIQIRWCAQCAPLPTQRCAGRGGWHVLKHRVAGAASLDDSSHSAHPLECSLSLAVLRSLSAMSFMDDVDDEQAGSGAASPVYDYDAAASSSKEEHGFGVMEDAFACAVPSPTRSPRLTPNGARGVHSDGGTPASNATTVSPASAVPSPAHVAVAAASASAEQSSTRARNLADIFPSTQDATVAPSQWPQADSAKPPAAKSSWPIGYKFSASQSSSSKKGKRKVNSNQPTLISLSQGGAAGEVLSGSRFFQCPACQKSMPYFELDAHLDKCARDESSQGAEGGSAAKKRKSDLPPASQSAEKTKFTAGRKSAVDDFLPVHSGGSSFGECPQCSQTIILANINHHLDIECPMREKQKHRAATLPAAASASVLDASAAAAVGATDPAELSMQFSAGAVDCADVCAVPPIEQPTNLTEPQPAQAAMAPSAQGNSTSAAAERTASVAVAVPIGVAPSAEDQLLVSSTDPLVLFNDPAAAAASATDSTPAPANSHGVRQEVCGAKASDTDHTSSPLAAKALFNEKDDWAAPDAASIPPPDFQLGFSTGAGKRVAISAKAMRQAEQKMHSDANEPTSHDSAPSSASAAAPLSGALVTLSEAISFDDFDAAMDLSSKPPVDFQLGFSTGAGSRVKISEQALKAAEEKMKSAETTEETVEHQASLPPLSPVLAAATAARQKPFLRSAAATSSVALPMGSAISKSTPPAVIQQPAAQVATAPAAVAPSAATPPAAATHSFFTSGPRSAAAFKPVRRSKNDAVRCSHLVHLTASHYEAAAPNAAKPAENVDSLVACEWQDCPNSTSSQYQPSLCVASALDPMRVSMKCREADLWTEVQIHGARALLQDSPAVNFSSPELKCNQRSGRRFNFSPSLLKSLLQKNVRLSRPAAAVRCALQLMIL